MLSLFPASLRRFTKCNYIFKAKKYIFKYRTVFYTNEVGSK